MPILLKVLSYKGLPLATELSAEFDQQGGTIGRKIGNTLVLTDAENFVSGRHAEILYQNGEYLIMDTSKNGTYLANAALNLNDTQAILHDHEILRIGEYEVLVEMAVGATASNSINIDSILSSPFADSFPGDQHSIMSEPVNISMPHVTSDSPFGERQPASPFHDSFIAPEVLPAQNEGKDIAEFLKGLDFLGSTQPPIEQSAVAAAEISEIPDASLIPPKAIELEPDIFFQGASDIKHPRQAEPTTENTRMANEPQQAVSAIASVPADSVLMQKFLEGAGVSDHSFLPQEQWAEAMKATGVLFRNLIEGLMDVLRARAEMKSEFRVSVTTIRSFDNNPLKFNPDVESVLKLMLAPNNPAFLNSNDAVNEAFRDIKYHQLAMTSGIQAAVAEILHRFEPEGFERILGEGVVFQKKARCWELYCEKYPELKALAIEDFFGEEFAEAYEKQMRLFERR